MQEVRGKAVLHCVMLSSEMFTVDPLGVATTGGVPVTAVIPAAPFRIQLRAPAVVELSTYPFVDGLPSAGSKKPVALYAAVPMGAEPSRTEPEPKMP